MPSGKPHESTTPMAGAETPEWAIEVSLLAGTSRRVPILTCHKCGARAAAFICQTPACPMVNGGVYLP